MKLVLWSLIVLFATGCQTVRLLSEKESSWIAVRETPYYCERIMIKNESTPICTEAILINSWNREKMLQYKNSVK